MKSKIVIIAAVSLVCVSSVAAQTSFHFDAGGAQVRYGDSASINAGTIGSALTALTPSTSFSAAAMASATEQSTWTMFGAAQGSVFTSAARRLRGELYGSGSGTTYGSGTGSAQLLAGGRMHFAAATAGLWVGAGAGGVADDIGWRMVRAGELAGWLQMGPMVLQAAALPVRISNDVGYTDAEATLRFGNARVEAGAVAGIRSALRGFDEATKAWAGVDATAWLLPSVGLTASAGSYPSDPGQNLPAARYLSLGVRFAPRRGNLTRTPLPSEPAPGSEATTSPALTVTGGPESRTIIVHVPAARTVELMADFTDWTPIELSAAPRAGSWTVTLPIAGGVHQLNIRIDGGPWMVPEGLTTITDEFGGRVGIVVIP